MLSEPLAKDFLEISCPGIVEKLNSNSTIFLDLDGVLADFEYEITSIFDGKRPLSLEEEEWEIIKANSPTLFSNLELMPSAITLMESFRTLGFSPKILTAIPKRIQWPEVTGHKREWVYKHFGTNTAVHFGPFAIDKQFHCRPGDILIDDHLMNVNQWKGRGGYAWLYKDILLEEPR